jgi:hypothetical protein
MKHVFNSAWRCNRKSIALTQSSFRAKSTISLSFVVLLTGLLTSCQKENVNASETTETAMKKNKDDHGNVVEHYTGFSSQTLWELKQARAATAKYRHLKHAIADGYADIGVVVPNMGHHYLKASLLDNVFDPGKPEILVYKKEEDGSFKLVAVEYAIPLNLSANAPTGFTGNHDEWDENTGFGLWLLHAWVWSYNPAGVFNPTNMLVHNHS